jgi:hypothetical protein
VRTDHVGWHRRMGSFGAVLGAMVAVLGIWTAVSMGRFNLVQLHQNSAQLTLLRSFYDIFAFALPFAMAIYWRTKPTFHRPLILVAMCALTDPAFSRFPSLPIDLGAYQDYGCVDLLVLLGLARDLTVSRRVNRIYLFALLGFLACQIAVVQAIRRQSPYWLKIAHAILN